MDVIPLNVEVVNIRPRRDVNPVLGVAGYHIPVPRSSPAVYMGCTAYNIYPDFVGLDGVILNLRGTFEHLDACLVIGYGIV